MQSESVPIILIVDDVEANRYVLRNIINDMEYQPILAENGLQAQRIIERMPVQLILLDVAMPEMDGYEFCQWIKANPLYREIPVIFISAFDNPDDVLDGFRYGGEDYITKPFIPEVVKARVSVHLKLSQANQTLQETNRRLQASVQEQLKQMEKEKKNMLYALAQVARENACYEETHMERIQYNCKLLSQAMQLSPQYEQLISDSFIETVEMAAPICDLGNVAIPMEILQKKNSLNEEERKIMHHHTEIGTKILENLRTEGDYNDFIQMSIDIVENHHENWDGSGYPHGKKGHQIPLSAQIVSVVSAYCALTEQRVYRPAYSKEEAMEIMQAAVDTKFNRNIVDILTKISRQLH